MERKPDYKNRTTKAERLPGKITKKLEQSKEVYKMYGWKQISIQTDLQRS